MPKNKCLLELLHPVDYQSVCLDLGQNPLEIARSDATTERIELLIFR